ncbi:MAG: thioredoxin peroxidase [Armatimonadetes bacterium CG2_30_66_41]|nr:peroxiredoxin [Armatimonadota bacterium]OIP00698.1 MAG: thioredoxin peroxidase [Armatimonadetes bacterium CG2_30_66_41]PIU89867.1 MAG: thioredoxin peroxidase [Armatimonadetes bacterium CG06_land_8_20_14_3_00_66_21]PIX45521.1 MAG: thioredoxin peroxidase [Armatimonadetes bacterium CG_4_8_14_3_um_filter_66_20]PJB75637.1 MAG: thioredoxin peroxidase [Armatimonadetes bacterium CG_4_9_14_3_um_filter_66_14]
MSLVGKQAPEFATQAVVGGEITDLALTDYKGKWVVLYFYPLDFTFVCPTEITAFSERHCDFEKLGAVVLGGSTDSVYSHKAWIENGLGAIKHPLFSDLTREISSKYGVLIREKGIALRGLFLIDPDGVVQLELVHNLGVGRSVDEVLRALKAFQTGELCPINWQPGQDTLGKG